MNRDKITISDIAREADVGVGTVSRVLNNSPNVKPATRERILDIIKAKGYTPNLSASRLARKDAIHTTIGILLPDLTNHYFFEIFETMFHQFRGRGYDVLLFNYERHDPDTIQKILNAQISYLFVFAFTLEKNETALLTQWQVPVIYVDISSPDAYSIYTDNRFGGEIAAQYLADKGAKKFCYISIHPSSIKDEERLEGFRKKTKQLGLTEEVGIYQAPKSEKDGYVTGLKIIEEGLYDGIFCFCDDIAIGVAKALREKDSSARVIGYDGISLARHMKVSTVSQNPSEMGEAAAAVMIHLIKKQELPSPMETVIAPTLLDFDS